MALNASGALSLGGSTVGQSVNLELGQAAGATITMNDTNLRTLFGVASGQISMSNGYGKSSFVFGGTKGYAGGGQIATSPLLVGGGMSVQIDGINFSTEAALDPAASLVQLRTTAGGVNSLTRGYAGGGRTSPSASPRSNEIDGMIFSTEAAINPAATIGGLIGAALSTNSTTTGYWLGGNPSVVLISGMTFSDETAKSVTGTLPTTKNQVGMVNSSSAGYAAGNGPSAPVNVFTKFLFSTETATNLASGMAVLRNATLCGVGSTTRGYFMGGQTNPGAPIVGSTEIDGIQFSDETTINPAATLATARGLMGGTNSATKGYAHGGSILTSWTNQIDGIQFSTETSINPAASLAQARSGAATFQDSNN